jgi:hypothetical protein
MKYKYMRSICLKSRNLNLYGTILFFILAVCCKSHDYQFTLVDDMSGEKLAARVSVTDSCGKVIQINGNPSHVQYLDRNWYYLDGSFSFRSKAKDITIEVQRGPETLPVKFTAEKGNGQQLIRLHRWVDMNLKGYLNGDIHIHTPFSTVAHLQMKAEDLNVLNILIGEDSVKNRQFTGRADPASGKGRIIYVAQEVRDWQMGHLTLLGLKSLVPGYPIVGGILENYRHTNWLMSTAADETHRQGGLVAWSHFSNLPGSESPVAIALGKIDALELMTYDDPTQLPSHWGPWKNSGMPSAEFTVMRGMDLWYQYLNSGFRLPIVAGTDKMADDIPIGSNRYYAYTGGDTTYISWLSAIKSGNGFITNGPLLDFTVNEYKPGDLINFHDKIMVRAKIIARSILPFATLEIIVNGRAAGHKTVFMADNPPVNGIYTMKLETDIELSNSSWIAARVADDPDNKNRILPRGLSVFAHTNPVYFLKNGTRIKEDASILYLRKYVTGTIHWLESNPSFENPEDLEMAIKLSKEAYNVYGSLLKP